MKIIKILIATLLIFSTAAFADIEQADASRDITIYLDGKKQSYSDKAVLENGSTLVPLRGIFEALGAEVTWNNADWSIDAVKGDTKIWLKIGSKRTKVNGKTVNISVPARIKDGSTLVPLRFISEALGADVKWDNDTWSVLITTPSAKEKGLELHFIDVGQGDSTLIRLETGEVVLVDAGTDAAGETVVAYLKSQGIKTIDYLIATHPDADHIGGMVDVMKAFKVLNFIDSGKAHTSATYERMLEEIIKEKAEYIVPEYGEVLESDTSSKAYLQILHVNSDANDNNDASLVVGGGYCGTEYLLMGDASKEIEAELIGTYDSFLAQILKAGHHGSNTSSSLEFLEAVNPEAVILSYGKGNAYGHPHDEVLENIKAVGAKAYSTAESGTIVATVDCDGYEIKAVEFELTETIKPTPTPTPTPEPKPEPQPDYNSGLYVVPGAQVSFKNCTELRTVYPNGVKLGHPSYMTKFDRDLDGWGCELYDDGEVIVEPTPQPTPQPTPTPAPSKTYKNCTELRKDHPNGVSSSHPAYQSKMDRDKDGWACE